MTLTLDAPPVTSADLIALLRLRDTDPAYADAPLLDAYGRISRDPETGETEKVDRQLFDCLRDVQRRHARLGEVLRDDGISAWRLNAKRPGWNDLVARLESRTSTGVITWHTDRLMRQPRDLERLIAFGEAGLLVASCHGDYNLSNADDRFTLRVLTAATAKESDSTSRRFKRKAEAMRASGHKSGGGRALGEPGSVAGQVVPAERVAAERAAIAWAVRGHLDGLSLESVAAEWNKRGLTTTRGNTWGPRAVVGVLKSPRLAGFVAHHGHPVGRLVGVEPIVSEQDWQHVVALFASRRRGRPPAEPYLLSGGHLLCYFCRQKMSGHLVGNKPFADGSPRRLYLCRKQGQGCGHISISQPRTDAAVREMVIRVLADPRHAKQLARRSAKLIEAEGRLSEAREMARELSARLGEGKLSLDRYDAAMSPLDARIARLAAEVESLRLVGGDVATRRASAAEVAAEWDDPATTVAQRRLMVRSVAPRGIVVRPATRAQRNEHFDAAERLEVIAETGPR